MSEHENESALKHMYNRDFLKRLANALDAGGLDFNRKKIMDLWPQFQVLEMKPRVHLVRDTLKALLPPSYPQQVRLLRQAVKKGDLSGFDLWPITEFVQKEGLNHLEISLDFLRELTVRFTSEFAIRPFLKSYPQESLSYLMACARDKNVHVRRWATEGTRPRLPWGEKLHFLIQDPKRALPILEILKFDPDLYVRKSVANHLNDISKDHPELVVRLLGQWLREAKGENQERVEWIIHRALRTLIKNGHAGALKLIGVDHQAQVSLRRLQLVKPRIALGERLDFSFEIQSTSRRSQKLVIDYVMYFQRANGEQSPKVFKLKVVELPAGGTFQVVKSHHVKKVTTRDYYEGEQALSIQVNGLSLGRKAWHLTVSKGR